MFGVRPLPWPPRFGALGAAFSEILLKPLGPPGQDTPSQAWLSTPHATLQRSNSLAAGVPMAEWGVGGQPLGAVPCRALDSETRISAPAWAVPGGGTWSVGGREPAARGGECVEGGQIGFAAGCSPAFIYVRFSGKSRVGGGQGGRTEKGGWGPVTRGGTREGGLGNCPGVGGGRGEGGSQAPPLVPHRGRGPPCRACAVLPPPALLSLPSPRAQRTSLSPAAARGLVNYTDSRCHRSLGRVPSARGLPPQTRRPGRSALNYPAAQPRRGPGAALRPRGRGRAAGRGVMETFNFHHTRPSALRFKSL